MVHHRTGFGLLLIIRNRMLFNCLDHLSQVFMRTREFSMYIFAFLIPEHGIFNLSPYFKFLIDLNPRF